jgi:hypothetical protein
MMCPLPLWAEVAFAAVEDQTNGTIAVTGNMLGIGVDVVSEPIYWTVRNGRCVAIEGGRDARELARVIEGVPNVDVVAEFAFGTSDKSPLGSPSEKGRIGNVHFALGDNRNAYPGGQNSARCLDGVLRNATLESSKAVPAAISSATEVGRLGGVRVVPLEDVPPIELPGGSWSRVILTGERVGSTSALGVSSSRRGPEDRHAGTRPRAGLRRRGSGELRLDEGSMPYGPGSALASRPASGMPSSTRGRGGHHGLRLPASRLSSDPCGRPDEEGG